MRIRANPEQENSMHMRITPAPTVRSVAKGERATDRYYDENLADNARRRLGELVKEKGGQTAAGVALAAIRAPFFARSTGIPAFASFWR